MLGGQIIEKLAANQWHVEHLTLVAIHHVNHECTTFKKSYSNLDMSGGITYTTPFLLFFNLYSCENEWKLISSFKYILWLAMKDWSVLPALIEVIDRDWVFTISVAVVRDEEVKKRQSNGWVDSGGFWISLGDRWWRQEERVRSTTRGSFRVGEVGRKKKGGERRSAEVLPVGTRGKSGQAMGNSWFNLNSKKLNFGPIGTKMAGVATIGGDEAF